MPPPAQGEKHDCVTFILGGNRERRAFRILQEQQEQGRHGPTSTYSIPNASYCIPPRTEAKDLRVLVYAAWLPTHSKYSAEGFGGVVVRPPPRTGQRGRWADHGAPRPYLARTTRLIHISRPLLVRLADALGHSGGTPIDAHVGNGPVGPASRSLHLRDAEQSRPSHHAATGCPLPPRARMGTRLQNRGEAGTQPRATKHHRMRETHTLNPKP